MGKHSKSKPDDSDKKNPKLNENFKRNPNGLIVWVICSIGIFVVLLSSVSIVFPGLIISIVDVNLFGEPFEIGTMGIPFIIINIIVFSLILLHLKKRLPEIFTTISEKIFSFDLC